MPKLSFDSIFLKNLKIYANTINSSKQDFFLLKFNGHEVYLPLFLAISYSTKVIDLLSVDETCREMVINLKFNNAENVIKIISIISDLDETNIEVEVEKEEDIYDFALFGEAFGCSPFVGVLIEHLKGKKTSAITKDNVIDIIIFKNYMSTKETKKEPQDISKEIGFISRRFSYFSHDQRFFSWCLQGGNDILLQQIIDSKWFRVESEDDLVNFIVNLCEKDQRFGHFISYISLQYCSKEAAQKFSTYISSIDLNNLIQEVPTIIQCLSQGLIQEKTLNSDNNIPLPDRYRKRIIDISSRNGEQLPSKYIKQNSTNSYTFLYPSEDPTTCPNIFKIIVSDGYYKLECYGASAGGCGGYSCGVLKVEGDAELFFGATDIRFNSEDLNSRIIVAGGAGGTRSIPAGQYYTENYDGGNGGGLVGGSGYMDVRGPSSSNLNGGTQTEHGKNGDNQIVTNSNEGGTGNVGGGGGGGYFGGGGGSQNGPKGGGGGSGYIGKEIISYKDIKAETKESDYRGNGYVMITFLE